MMGYNQIERNMHMQITRTEVPTGGPERTRREEIVSLLPTESEAEPEVYDDCSQSEGWPWDSNPAVCTWDVQVETLRQLIVPFEQLDSQAAAEQADGDDDKGGVYRYAFSNIFLPTGDGEDDGDLNSANFDEKMGEFYRKYFDGGRRPVRGGTEIMAAIAAGDAHYLGTKKKKGEFYDTPRADRPVRMRVVLTDGVLQDADKFRKYLEQATLSPKGYGAHGEWDEVWGIAILGEQGGGGKAAYSQYKELAKTHPWIHAYYFESVTNPAEIAEDMAVAAVPVLA
jgi:hypothetical protein